MSVEKESFKYLVIYEADTIKQVPIKEIIKSISQENEKTTRNQTIWQKSDQWDKYLGYPYRKILRNILEVDERDEL